MADYTNSKSSGIVFPERAVAVAHEDLEPLIGPDQVKSRHLFGMSLASSMKDPITGKAQVMQDETVREIIDGALRQAEIDCRIDIMPVKRSEKQAFDRHAYEAFGYFKLLHRPITSIDKVAVTPPNGVDIYTLPLEWVETAYAARGQINIIPVTAGFQGAGFLPSGTAGGSWFLGIIGNRSWLPAYWLIEYTSGFPDGMVPRAVNELIGTIAAQEILSMLAATNARNSSHSLGLDGMSQSVSTPGPQIYKNRFDELEAKRTRLIKRIRNLFGQGIFSSHI